MNVREILLDIRAKHGDLTPEILVQVAKSPKHPLHSRFTWDDTEAAKKWRLEEGAHLIRSVRIVREDRPDAPADLRAFVAVRGADGHRASYVPTEVAMEDEFTRELVLRQMKRDWETLRRRYQHMSEFAALVRSSMSETA